MGYFGPELVQNGDFSELGPELVVNGDFATDSDWTKGTGWSISGGKANCDGSQTSQTTLESIPNLALGVGNLFKITFDISNYSSGQIDLITLVGTGGPEITNINANGSYTAYSFGESTGNSRIQIIANSDFVGSIDNVSVKQVDPNDYWYASAPWSITNQGAFYDDTSGNRLDQSNLNLVQNKLYKLTFDIENTTGNELDKLARKNLNSMSLDYAHGTGHGVGYYLNVHEGPQSISKFNEVKFREGMILSNEPGFYKKGLFGIRIENLVYVKKSNKRLLFENLTLVQI